MRDTLAKIALCRKDVVCVQGIVVAGKAGELNDVRVGNGSSWGYVGLAHGHVFEEDWHGHLQDVERSRFLRDRRSMVPAIARGSVPGGKIWCFWIFCVPVVGKVSTNWIQPGAL